MSPFLYNINILENILVNSMDIKYELIGKTLVFTDIHLGIKNSNTTYLNICAKIVKELIISIKNNNVKNVIFCGDLFHSRKTIDINTLNYGLKLISAIAKYAKVYLICGNHDIYYKNTLGVNSINIFKDNPNIIVVDTLTLVKINNQIAALIPWLSDTNVIEKESIDLAFGHFEISNNYLIASYVEKHINENKTPEVLVDNILNNELFFAETSTDGGVQTSDEVFEIVKRHPKSADLVGDFIEIVKTGGVIYSGHIHSHEEFYSRDRLIIFVGSPYQQTFGEMDSTDGYYILDCDNSRKFYEITSAPIRIKLYMSKILECGIKKFDFSCVRGNIIKRIYDVDVSKKDEFKILQLITDNQPLDEDMAEYEVSLSNSVVTSNTLDLIKKSKLEYIKSYVDNIDESVLDSNSLVKENVYKLLELYYNKVVLEETT